MTNEELAKSILMELEGGYISYGNFHGNHEQGLNLIKGAIEKQIGEFFGICPHSYHEFDLKFKEARMTNEEAINSLESVRYLRKVCTEDIDAITLAIHALEKQVPRPVKVYKASPNHIIMCPSCYSTFVARNNVVMNHCNNCGQAVELVDEKGEE